LKNFTDLGLCQELLNAVADAGYTTPTPIQVQAIPVVLSGQDVMGGAQTGTGKTAGFGLPILQKLMVHANNSPSPARHPVRALILTPTRELAIQVEESIRLYAKYTLLRSTVVYGGVNIKQQTPTLLKGIEILVATPGRLLDHLEQKTVALTNVEFFVLDEADRMLDMGFIPDIRRIIKQLPKKRQSLLFSATFSSDIKKLADDMLNKPRLIEVARRNTTAETVEQSVYLCAATQKKALLEHIVTSHNLWQALCFVKTRQGASRLARALEKDGVVADAIHGDKTQTARIDTLEKFRSGKTQLLVATDVAARGLDIEELPIVINYDIPRTPEDYVHRIGRTGRAGAAGEAISFVTPDEEKYLLDIEKLINKKIERLSIDDKLTRKTEDKSRKRESSANSGRMQRDEREAAYAKNPDQQLPKRKKSVANDPVAGTPPFAWKSRPVPALLMKRPKIVADHIESKDKQDHAQEKPAAKKTRQRKH
jgi:superfamily II DNA/RNA helicase